jgi:predicted esterase
MLRRHAVAPLHGAIGGVGNRSVAMQRIVRVCFAFLLIGTLAGTSVVSATTPPTNPNDDFFLYIPTNAAARGPLQVLVTVHGMGGNGAAFCQALINRAEQDGWIIVSPTYHYRDNFNPVTVRQDDTELIPRLTQYLDNLPAKTGLPIRDKVLLYGFSRGAQIVHRFAEFYPDRTLAVALFAAGTYTLPVPTMKVNGTPTTLDLPYGVADLQHYTGTPFDAASFRKVPFFIGVGGADDHAGDAPPAWDAYDGTTRLARAENFAQDLKDFGLDTSLTVYPGVGHDITSDMRSQAMSFLEQRAFFATLAQTDQAVAHAYLSRLA